MINTTYKYFIYLLLLTIVTDVQGATIIDAQVGRHKGYSLIVIACDVDVRYRIDQQRDLIKVIFPPGTQSNVSVQGWKAIEDNFFRSIKFNGNASELVLQVAKNFKLKSYQNSRPFQLVMDFTILPGNIVKPAEKPPVKEIQPAPKETDNQPSVKPSFPRQTSDGRYLPADAYARGMALKAVGDYHAALEAFQEAVPSRGVTALFQTALMYDEIAQREKAIETLVEVINQVPSWIEPRVKLALLYKLSGRDGLAERLLIQVFEITMIDTSFDFSGMGSQIAYLEELLNADKYELDEEFPPIDKKSLPKIPYIPIAVIVGIAGIVVAARIISNRRMDKMLNSALDDLGDEDLSLPVDNGYGTDTTAEKPAASSFEEDFSDFVEDTESIDIPDKKDETPAGGITDEKQQMIYELLDQNYSISEIAKMLDMGQEEVKFIIDFRSKDGD